MLTEDELASQLRQHGIEDAAEVKHAALEPDGSISVVRYSNESSNDGERKRRPGAG